MAQSAINPASFVSATDTGTVVEKDGYHQPGGRSFHLRSCGCNLTTPKGAYRDVTVETPDGRVIHYYHQSPVVVEHPDGSFVISSCGYRTSTTKERINQYIPSGYFVRQEDYEWYLEQPDGSRVEFQDGMVIS